MKGLWRKITGALAWLAEYLQAFGAAGLFAVALLDSAFVPLPGGPDAVMLVLSTARPSLMPVYALSAVLGSTIGCLFLYYVSRKAGRRALESVPKKKQERVKELVDRYDVLSVLVASLLPPPFPFKLFVITAGVFHLKVVRFALAVAAGRAARFFLEGFIAVRYGEQAKDVLAKNFASVGLGLALLVVLFFVVRALLKKRRKADESAAEEARGEGVGGVGE